MTTFTKHQTRIRIFSLGCCIFFFPAFSAGLSPHDTLAVNLCGGAAISFLHGAGQKASETGLLIASLDHGISDDVHAVCAIRGGGNSLQSFIEEADIKWNFGHNRADIGFVGHRYGFALHYRENSPFYFLFDKPMLWDATGFGFTYSRRMGAVGLDAASSINTRENSQAHVLLTVSRRRVTSRLVAGFESYSTDNQDNGISSGLEIKAHGKRLKIHGIVKYADFLGYGHAANPTMVPGTAITGFLEVSARPAPALEVSGVSYVLKTRKRYDHEFYFEGLESTWMFLEKFGLGAGCEWQKDDDAVSLMPRLFAKALPAPDQAEVEVSVQPTVIKGEITSYRVSGEIWIRM